MDNKLKKAKNIFFDHACNRFFMDRNGVSQDYDRYGATKTQEAEWRQEYISMWVSRLSVDDLTAVRRLEDAWATEALPDLIRMADTGDSYANAIWEIANGTIFPNH